MGVWPCFGKIYYYIVLTSSPSVNEESNKLYLSCEFNFKGSSLAFQRGIGSFPPFQCLCFYVTSSHVKLCLQGLSVRLSRGYVCQEGLSVWRVCEQLSQRSHSQHVLEALSY